MSACEKCGLTTSCKCNEPERILHAAVLSEGGALTFFGKCHADCFYKGQAMGIKMSGKSAHQGFLTNKGNYLSREDAAKLAFSQGQITKPRSYLLSEDLWCEKDGGLYDHDEIKGYVRR